MVADNFSEFRTQLVSVFPELTPQLQTAAGYMLNHPDEVGLSSMRQVAAAAGVKPATITRLSKTLGFVRYDFLRELFRQRLRTTNPGYVTQVRAVQERNVDDVRPLLEEVRAQDVRNIQTSLSEENFPILIEAVRTMLASRRVYVLGLRGAYSAAFLFHYAYQMFRENSLLLDGNAGVFADQLRGLGSDDCMLAVSFPPYTHVTIETLHFAAEAGVRIIAITDSVVSAAAQVATHTIVTEDTSPSFYQSFTASVSVVHALITALVFETGDDALTAVKETERQLSRISAYW